MFVLCIKATLLWWKPLFVRKLNLRDYGVPGNSILLSSVNGIVIVPWELTALQRVGAFDVNSR